ncbi:unnamed protein product [Microthlaspi erraticum]|uniref:TF-B3 domain-containing protein n=1 Tax=Microthlaspi erraticum TaxID=1685480 RepID=A0A6D2IZP6_9BRAS|nr:unnamed protein product [Microthlaspi erraticum]
MSKSRRLHPQFFHTLVNGFQTHLTIPADFFSKYVEGKSLEKTTAEVKSDGSDINWKVKMTDRRLGEGWEEFAVAHELQIGDVVLVRYEGDMVFHVSDLGPNWCELPSNDNDGQDDIGRSLLKKRLYPTTQVDFSSNDDVSDTELLPRKKKVKKNSPEAEAEAVSSSSSDKSCFVAIVTASNLLSDKLYLPQHFTNLNGLTRNCRKIVIIDGEERSWLLDLRFDESSDTFYISQRWRSFCEENSQKAGGFFRFKLVGNGETPVLSFCPEESIDTIRQSQRECTEASGRESLSTELSNEDIDGYMEPTKIRDIVTCYMVSKEERRSWEREKNNLRGRDSTPSSQKQFVTLTVTPYSVEKCLRSLPRKFTRTNDINEPGMITLLGRDGIKQQTKLHLNKVTGSMNLGDGWRCFVEANGLKIGNSFTFKLIWEDKTPVLSLCCDSGQEEFSKAVEKKSLVIDPSKKQKMSKNENNKEKNRSVEREKKHRRQRVSTPSSQKEFVTLTITPYSVEKNILRLPRKFTKENEINTPGMVTLLGKDGMKQQTKLYLNKVTDIMTLGNGWRCFAKANGLKTGDSFTLKLSWEGTTPVLSLWPAESSIDKGAEGGECSETNQEKSLPIDNNKKKANGINNLGR